MTDDAASSGRGVDTRATCRVCGAPVEKTALGVCGRDECEARGRALDAIARLKPTIDTEMARLAAERKEALEREQRAIETDLQREASQTIHKAGLAAEDVLILPVPYFDVELTPASSTRRAALGEHLRGILERSQGEPVAAACIPDEPEADPVILASCTLCRGKCCSAGGNHAFLDETALRSVKPGASHGSIIDLYLRFVPDAGCQNSCIFHGSEGCTLPRPLRSDTCNRHLCSQLRTAKAKASVHPDHALVLGAIADGKLQGTRVLDVEERRPSQ